MRAQGLDEFRLAAIVRRQKRTVDTWVAGERLPQRAEEIALADALNVSIDWLSGRSEALK